MILPLSSISTSPDTAYPLPNLYGIGYFGRNVPKKPMTVEASPVRMEIRDAVILSPAAQRLMDQAERLKQINSDSKE